MLNNNNFVNRQVNKWINSMLQVGFFPCECVEIIGDKVPQSFKIPKSSAKPGKSLQKNWHFCFEKSL